MEGFLRDERDDLPLFFLFYFSSSFLLLLLLLFLFSFTYVGFFLKEGRECTGEWGERRGVNLNSKRGLAERV